MVFFMYLGQVVVRVVIYIRFLSVKKMELGFYP